MYIYIILYIYYYRLYIENRYTSMIPIAHPCFCLFGQLREGACQYISVIYSHYLRI